jgi:hypothetical protein
VPIATTRPLSTVCPPLYFNSRRRPKKKPSANQDLQAARSKPPVTIGSLHIPQIFFARRLESGSKDDSRGETHRLAPVERQHGSYSVDTQHAFAPYDSCAYEYLCARNYAIVRSGSDRRKHKGDERSDRKRDRHTRSISVPVTCRLARFLDLFFDARPIR